jgi:hypothetical protein
VRALTTEDMLRAWESCEAAHPAEWALTLLAIATGEDRATLARLPVGERDARLLELRTRTFGTVVDAFVECPACGESLEFSTDGAGLRAEPPALARAATHKLAIDGGEIEFRLLDAGDLADAARAVNAEAAGARLIERAVVALTRGGEARPASELSAAERAVLAERLAELDPQADVTLDLRCPACAHAWESPFDVAAFVAGEIRTRARRLLREVAALASAYGWSESEVLSLSAARRRAYLDLAQA